MKTLPVMFRMMPGDDVTAVFPTKCFDYAGRLLTVYAHVGQHAGASFDWLRQTRPAKPAEYADLLAELQQIYTHRPAARSDIYGEPVQLVIAHRMTSTHRKAFRASQAAALRSLRECPEGAPWSPSVASEAVGLAAALPA